ncbi:thioredoxin family protein [Ponticaulis sp.]|uniref:thioredoxin family protein n=1 Tax=Ponticaulis sp. TaxID=2020902 RepID=UPI0025D7BB22|nr:thioredoxin family protein [Ponticaulis sp.]
MKSGILLLLAVFGLVTLPASAASRGIQIVSFTADWCPTCRVFDPALEDAVEHLSDRQIEWITVDLTDSRGASRERSFQMWADFRNDMQMRGMGQIYNAYNMHPYTGYAVVLAADTKEPLVCLMGLRDPRLIQQRLITSLNRVNAAPPGQRPVYGTDCPDSYLGN